MTVLILNNHNFLGLQMIPQIQLVIVPLSKEIMSFLAWYAGLPDSINAYVSWLPS